MPHPNETHKTQGVDYEIMPLYIEREQQMICTNNRLEYGLMYLF